ncbi:hypothetical protein C5167_032577 [Papaver somniferum]|uniref:Aminotransferase-like plant mobile domain-containing protein n=1 Tax=Papaver somniferum TaxID=3469 RepID=A0A4Y7K807_PAPSO|nr:hypothetical protein C5167_032577 [Papaver somniferum]
MTPIRNQKKDKKHMPTPPSKPPRHTKYLNAGPFRGKNPDEVPLSIDQPRDPNNDSSDSSPSSTPVVSASGSDEEEIMEQEEIHDDGDDGNDGNGGFNGSAGLGGGGDDDDEEEEEYDEGNVGKGVGGDDDDDEEEEKEDDEGNDGKGVGGDDEEIVEEQVKPTRRKDGKPVAESARHIPARNFLLEPLRGGKARGEPRDGCEVLFGYKGSWACTIYETIDHKNAVRLFRRQSSYAKMSLWDLKDECESVKEIIENSALYTAVVNSVIAYDKVAVSSFSERFYGETHTFFFPFGEMALTPDDADQILGLPVEGKSTNDKFKKRLSWEEIYGFTERLFGWDQETTYGIFVKGKKYRKKEFKLVDVREMFAGTLIREKVEGLSDMQCRNAAAGYFLYTLGSVIFPESKGNRVSVNLLQLLDHLEDVNNYSWGTSMVAHLNCQLSTAFRERSSQIHGNTALLQVWIYDRFPSLIKDNIDVKINPEWNKTKPRGTRYLYTGCQDKEQKDALLEMRQKLDNITAEEVVFDPYKNDWVSAMEDVVYYSGPLFYPYGFSMYNPMRIMRQLGYIQYSPVPDYEPRFKHKLDNCESDDSELVDVYEPEPKTKHWDDRHKHDSKIDISFWEHVNEGHQSTADYLEWYERFSHPRVIRIDPPDTQRSNKASSSASTSDTRDDSTILKLVRERMKIIIKAFCCSADKGEVIEPERYCKVKQAKVEEAKVRKARRMEKMLIPKELVQVKAVVREAEHQLVKEVREVREAEVEIEAEVEVEAEVEAVCLSEEMFL